MSATLQHTSPSDLPPTVRSSPRWRPPEEVFGPTYYLLRWSMPVLLLWLALAITYAWVDSGLELPMTSISAYYYTNAQTVFVGVLISLGALLIIIQGRTPWEDALMNTAGALAPFVALLPTPVEKSDTCLAAYCTDKFLRDAVPNNHELIAFNIRAVVPIWLILCSYLALRAWSLRLSDPRERRSSLFSAVATSAFGVLAMGLWFSETERRLFYDWAHLASAAIMVALLIASMIPFALWMGRSQRAFFRNRPVVLSNGFWVMFWLIVLGLGACVAGRLLLDQWDHTVLVVEIVAIAPFLVYWVMQGFALGRLDRHKPAGQRSA